MSLNNFSVQSYELQDGRWGVEVILPLRSSNDSISVSEPIQFDRYFNERSEALDFGIKFLKDKGVDDTLIQIINI